MCGRLSLSAADHRAAAALLSAAVPGFEAAGLSSWLKRAGYEPHVNVGPAQRHWLVRGRQQRPILDTGIWGLRRHGGPPSKLVINARVETVAERPMFRAAFTHARALIPADGFFEWAKTGSGRQPHWFHPPDRRALMLAAVVIPPGPDQADARFAILTRPATASLRWIHARMPVMVEPASVGAWLFGERPDALAGLASEPPALASFPVSPRFNLTSYEGPLVPSPEP